MTNTIARGNGLCYCTAPWRDSIRVPPRPTLRGHIANEACEYPVADRRPEWLRRMDKGLLRAKELTW